MSATQESNAPSMSASERAAERKARGPVLRDKARKLAGTVAELVEDLAQDLRYVRDNLFTTGEVKAGKLDAYIATWTGLGSSTWKGYVRAADILAELSPGQRSKVSTWTLDSIKTLGPLDADERKAVLSQVGSNPSEATVKAVRQRVKPSGQRNVPDAAETTSKLAESIREQVAAVIGSDPTQYVAMIAGAQMAQEHRGQDVAAAILFLSLNPASQAQDEDQDS